MRVFRYIWAGPTTLIGLVLAFALLRRGRVAVIDGAHERVHVRQYEAWGPLFIPAYLLAGVCALFRGRHPYFDNKFEKEARSRSA